MFEAIRIRSDPLDVHPILVKVVGLGSLAAVALAIFGLPPVSMHSPLHRLGVMDPLCGMTRAVRYAARGEFPEAWRYNPASFVLGAFAVAVVARWCAGSLTGHWWNLTVVSRGRVYTMLAIPTIALWINQQLHVSLLR